MESFDYVIVGAGSAGCVLAFRLAEQGCTVCVLEAGPPDTNPYIRVPAGFMKTYDNPALTWSFAHEGTEHTLQRRIPFIQGKLLGGSSAVNGTIYSRGQAADYDLWARMGADGWDHASVLPYFRRNESYMGGGEDAYRGREGRLRVDRFSRPDALCDTFIEAARQTGVPLNPDYNGRTQTGVGYAQATIWRGRRWSAAHCYLHPARRRFKVDVRTHALVRRVLVEHGRATGVEYSVGDDPALRTVKARRCTIVSAGTVNTTRLLQLSGFGPAQLLQDLGVPVLADLPGLGENLADHYAARIVARARSGVDTVNLRARGLPLLREVAAYLAGRPSILAMSVVAAYAFCKEHPGNAENDYLLSFTPASFREGMTRQLEEVPGFSSGAYRLRPESRGFIRARSRDVRDAPVVNPNYLAAESDRRILIAALKHSTAILTHPAMQQVFEQQIFPREPCRTDDEWLDFIRRYGLTTYHLVGTCRMGQPSDAMAVVDPRLRLRGVRDLRVVDASVMPTTPSGNTNAATLMIAEKAADMILEDYRMQRLA
jgi:choline dehydrogenase